MNINNTRLNNSIKYTKIVQFTSNNKAEVTDQLIVYQ